MCRTVNELFPTQESGDPARTFIIEKNGNCRRKNDSFGESTGKSIQLAESLNKSADAIIEQGEERKIARQKKNLMEKTEKIHEIKELLREVKITAETDEQETEAAINEIEERAEVFEDAIDEFYLKLIKIQAEAKRRARDEEMALERAYEQEKMDGEYRQREKEERERLRRQAEHEDEQLERRLRKMEQQQPQVKLPKLVISKFNGTYLDWLRFWEQFTSQIDKSDCRWSQTDLPSRITGRKTEARDNGTSIQ